jgi:hypothetical protein
LGGNRIVFTQRQNSKGDSKYVLRLNSLGALCETYQVSIWPDLSRIEAGMMEAATSVCGVCSPVHTLVNARELQHFVTPAPIFLAVLPADRLQPERKAMSKKVRKYFISFYCCSKVNRGPG